MRIFQTDSTSTTGFSIFSLGHLTVHQAGIVAALVDGHLAVDTLEPVLLDRRDAPDHLVARLTEGWLAEVGLLELVAFYRETSLDFVSPVVGVLRRHLEDLLLLHVDREGDGAATRKILYQIHLAGCPAVQTLLQVGDLKLQLGDTEGRQSVGVVEDLELEFVIHQDVRDL